MIQRRASGSVGSFFWRTEAQAREEGVSEYTKREVMMQPAPGTPFKMVEAEFFF